MTPRANWRDVARELVEGRRIVLIGTPLAAVDAQVRTLRALGAGPILVIVTARGTGPAPGPHDADILVIDAEAASVRAQIAADEAGIAYPSNEVRRAMDAFDPHCDALVFPQPVLGVLPPTMLERPIVGHRLPAWCALEDKLIVDALWDAAGVARLESRCVAARADDVLAAARELDRGAGTVWAADATRGPNGGADGTRWVRDAVDAEEALTTLLPMSTRLRVMPFVEGIPVGVTGFVLPDGVVALRPLEGLTLRAATPPRLRYVGVSSVWEPPLGDRDSLRDVVRRVGAVLADRWGYRGGFTVDGVLSSAGFVPTELNPRLGAGALMVQRAAPDLPLEIFNRAVVAGGHSAVAGDAFEVEVTTHMDTHPTAYAWSPAGVVCDETSAHALVFDGGVLRPRTPGEPTDVTIVTGPGVAGGRVDVRFEPTAIAPGGSVAALACEGFAWADAVLGTRVGPLAPPANG